MPESFYIASLNRIRSRSTWAPEDDGKQHLYDGIAVVLSRKLIDRAFRRIRTERLSEWHSACDDSGPRSPFRWDEPIAGQIYYRAKPIPDVLPSPDRNALLQEVASAMRETSEPAGADLL